MDQQSGARIRSIRSDRGMNQKDLADKCGVTRQAVATWEHGRIPHPKKRKLLLKALGLRTWSQLLGG